MNVLPCARRARHGDLAAEQADELAADREAEPGAAVEASGRAVALRERLEDPLLLLVVDADAGVADREGDDGRRPSTSDSRLRLQPLSARPICTCTVPCSVNLNALASRFLRIWRRRCGSVTIVVGAVGREVDRVAEALALGRRARTRGAGRCAARRSETSAISAVTVPDSTLARSRMLLSSSSSSLPDEWMTLAYSTCVSVMLCVGVVLELLRRGSAGCSAACAARATCWR